jgi:hypothetical protein
MAKHSERITPQFVSSAVDVQEKMRAWAGRAVQSGFSEDAGSGNRIVLRRRPKQGYIVIIVAPIIGFFYGGFMYGDQAAIIYALIFAVLGLCGLPIGEAYSHYCLLECGVPLHRHGGGIRREVGLQECSQ